MDVSELQTRLATAQERLKKAIKAMAPKHKGGEWEELKLAHANQLSIERELAAAKGDEYAVPLDFPVKWDVGAPLPHLIANDYKTFLIFLVHAPDPNWDGTYVTVRDPHGGTQEQLALVEFVRCASVKMGTPNDEVLSGHPLHGKGLNEYTAQLVENSKWLRELEAINKVHPGYKAERWLKLKHYIFWFHDSSFECVAESFKVEVHQDSLSGLYAKVGKMLFG